MIDLHTHSTASDGTLSPAELVAHAYAKGISAIALTDHDTVAGIPAAVAAASRIGGFELIPGIELSVESKGETHVLGYFIDVSNRILNDALEEIRRVRILRGYKTAENLTAAGMPVTVEEALEFSGGGAIARIHFAKLLVKKGYCKTVAEAMRDWLSPGKPGHCSQQAITAEQAVEIIRAAGGDAYVAHLHTTGMEGSELYDFLRRLKSVGLAGIECFYTEYTEEMTREYIELAGSLGLKRSGGTDFHGNNKPHIEIGIGHGGMKIGEEVLAKMRE
ncbi:MAG: PHP domain-containing protein [Eubacteriales bacterium]|nr:PHP domain-containing protein [Clostridiales bacterium]